MHSPANHDLQAAAISAGNEEALASELSILRDVFRLLPTGVTVQDERGDFLLVNDAAAALLQLAATASAPCPLNDRRDTCLELLRTGRPAVLEESLTASAAKQVFLTSHRPVRIAERNLLLSSSADITEQKAFEDQLFRSAYYDELTGLPARRVIEHRVNSLLRSEVLQGNFALAFLDIDNFKHINDYYGHVIGDALLVEITKRLALDLRESDVLSRISGDEFLLLLNPIQSEAEVAEYIHFILQRLKAPFFIDASRSCPTSIGVASTRSKTTNCCARTPTSRCIASKRCKGAAAFFDAGMSAGAGADEDRAVAAAGHSEKAFAAPFSPRSISDQRRPWASGAGAAARRRGRDPGPGTFINLAVDSSDRRTDDLALAEIVKSIDLINETFGPDTCQHQCRPTGRQSRIHAAVRGGARATDSAAIPIEVTEDAFVTRRISG